MKAIWIIPWALALPAPGAAAPSSSPNDTKEVRAVIENSVDSVLDILKNKDLERAERKRKVLAVVDPLFDLPLMGKLVLGKANWPKFSEAQRKEFTGLFITTIRDSYYEKIDLFSDETVEFEPPKPGEKGKFQMPTRIISKGKPYELLYKLYRSGSSWKVYDIEIEGISLVRSYGSQYDQFLQKSSADGLLAKMREKTLDAPQELKLSKKGQPSGDKPAAAPMDKP